jgi:tRNA(Ile)-lysidine synthetase-like protein
MQPNEIPILDKVKAWLYEAGTPSGIAFSGGIDSTVLLYILRNVFSITQLRAIYVCHSLRPSKELSNEIALVHRICKELRTDLTVVTIRKGTIEDYAKEEKCGVEAAARHFRYIALKRVAKKHHISVIYAAHHADDQRETFLMNLLRGGSLESLSGIPRRRVLDKSSRIQIIRPLLDVSREDIYKFAKAHKIEWSEDSTNNDLAFFRNKVRHLLVPYLNERFPYWKASTAHYQRQFSEIRNAAKNRAMKVLSELRKQSKDPTCISLIDYRKEAPIVRYEILRRFLIGLKSKKPLRGNAIRDLDTAIMHKTQAIEAGGYAFKIRGDFMILDHFARFSSSPNQRALSFLDNLDAEYYFYKTISNDGKYDCGPYNLEVKCFSGSNKSSDAETRFASCDNCYKLTIEFPFVVRNARSFEHLDAFMPTKDSANSLKIKKHFPIIEDKKGIAAVLFSACSRGSLAHDWYRKMSLCESAQIVYILVSTKGDLYFNA